MHSPTPTSLYSTGSGRYFCPDQLTSPESRLGDDEKKRVMAINKKLRYSYSRTKKGCNALRKLSISIPIHHNGSCL